MQLLVLCCRCRLAENGTNSFVGDRFDFDGNYGTRFWGNPNGGPNYGGGKLTENGLFAARPERSLPFTGGCFVWQRLAAASV